jgi:hypothetical protein
VASGTLTPSLYVSPTVLRSSGDGALPMTLARRASINNIDKNAALFRSFGRDAHCHAVYLRLILWLAWQFGQNGGPAITRKDCCFAAHMEGIGIEHSPA